MRALVVYESMFGDNQQVAEAVAAGLRDVGVTADAVEVGGAPTAVDPEVDLLVVGAPNHGFSLPRPTTRQDAATKRAEPVVSQGIGVREWLEAARLVAGVRTAAYDTRSSHPKALVKLDHASTTIDKALGRLGGSRLAVAEHFRVADVTGPLEPGEVERAEAWGRALGKALAG